jgi:hypothetical protein
VERSDSTDGPSLWESVSEEEFLAAIFSLAEEPFPSVATSVFDSGVVDESPREEGGGGGGWAETIRAACVVDSGGVAAGASLSPFGGKFAADVNSLGAALGATAAAGATEL